MLVRDLRARKGCEAVGRQSKGRKGGKYRRDAFVNVIDRDMPFTTLYCPENEKRNDKQQLDKVDFLPFKVRT